MPPVLLMKFAICCTLMLLLELLLSVCLWFSFSSVGLHKSRYLTLEDVFIGYIIVKSFLKISLDIHFGYSIEEKRHGKNFLNKKNKL